MSAPPADPLAAAIDAHRRGDFAAALPLYDKALRRTPNHPDALHLSGLALLAVGDADAGLKRLRSAIVRRGEEPSFRASLVQALAQLRRWPEAAAAAAEFARKLPAAPAAARCLLALANMLFDAGRPVDAAPLYRQAQPLLPDSLEAIHNAACCLRDLGRRDDARRGFAAALLRDPAAAETLLAAAALTADDPRLLRRALLVAAEPRADLAAALAAARLRGGDPAAALAACRAATALDPAAAGGWINAAAVSADLAHAAAAAEAARRAVRLSPTDPQAQLNLGMARQRGLKQPAAAQEAYRRAAALAPADAAAWRNIGAAALALSAFDDALTALDRGLRTAGPADVGPIHSNRGVALMSSGRQGAAVAAFRAALEWTPGDLSARSNLLFCLCFDADTPPEAVFADHAAYEKFVPAAPFPPRTAATASGGFGRLRVGYVSPDFQRYPGPGFHFLSPLLSRHDRARFSIVCYYDDVIHDAATAQFQADADLWRDAAGWSDDRLARQVAADGVDILVDCGGHMSRNRMAAFARRMAPVQISFPLYPNTTGLSAMDYQFGDKLLTPPFMQAYRREALIRLPGTVLCYRPAESACAPPLTAPWETAGAFTFASFNNLAKLDAATVATWAEILTAAPGAILALKWRGLADGVAARLQKQFADHGVGPERLRLMRPTPDPYEAYAAVDLCLDPLFAAGGTTTCDALWMGVPILTLPGRTAIGRWGASLLSAVGLEQSCIAASRADYVARAVAFAQHPVALSAVRAGLRQRVQASPLMDEGAYVRAVERAYDEIRRRLQAGEAHSPFDVAPFDVAPDRAPFDGVTA